MIPQELKNSILQLAIQGKLVEQRPEEGTAEELYREIQAEKQRLIKARKLKKEKPLPKMAEEEKPFEIPESWMWVRIHDVAESSLGKTLNKATNSGISCPYLCSINVYWDGIKLDTVKEALFTDTDRTMYLLKKGDLLVCEGGDAGRCAVWDKEGVMYYQNALHRIRFFGGISSTFFCRIFELYKANGIIEKHCKGETIKHLVQSNLYKMFFPLPPLAEQKRIVAKIEELLPYIDRYEQAWSRLEAFNQQFPDDMRKSILQLAIQGKLVEQRFEEGTGDELYREIQAEKLRLIREGKIKNEKPLPEITEDEKPFEIPESWMWIRVGNCGSWSAGATPPRTNAEYYNGNIPWLKTGDLNDGIIKEIPEHISDLALEKTSVRINPVGSVLMAMYGATIGKLGILAVEATTNQACCACIPYSGIYNEYLFFYLMARRPAFIKMGEGGAQPNISKEKIVGTVFPLPPLAEQKRIVTRLEELLAVCEKLK